MEFETQEDSTWSLFLLEEVVDGDPKMSDCPIRHAREKVEDTIKDKPIDPTTDAVVSHLPSQVDRSIG